MSKPEGIGSGQDTKTLEAIKSFTTLVVCRLIEACDPSITIDDEQWANILGDAHYDIDFDELMPGVNHVMFSVRKDDPGYGDRRIFSITSFYENEVRSHVELREDTEDEAAVYRASEVTETISEAGECLILAEPCRNLYIPPIASVADVDVSSLQLAGEQLADQQDFEPVLG